MNADYLIEWSGDLPIDALQEEDSGARPTFTAEDRELLRSMLERRRAAGQRLLRRPDGELPDLYRLTGFEAARDGLRLVLGRTDYAQYLLTNVEHPEWRATRGDRVMSDALAVCAALITSDGCVAWGERSGRILDSTARYHLLPSGHPEPPDGVVAGLFTELREEAGLLRGEIDTARWTGFVRSRVSGKPELTALLRASVPFAAIEERERESAWEFSRLFALPWRPDAVRAWLLDHARDAVPPGHAALLLAGAVEFGARWRARCERDLAALDQASLRPRQQEDDA